MTEWTPLLRVGHYGWPVHIEVTDAMIEDMAKAFGIDGKRLPVYTSFMDVETPLTIPDYYASIQRIRGWISGVEVRTDRLGTHLAVRGKWTVPRNEPAQPADGPPVAPLSLAPYFQANPARLLGAAFTHDPVRRYNPITGEVLPL